MTYNGMINSHFKGRPILAVAEDPHRGRTINIHFIGEEDKVGITDGVDSWIAQAVGCFHNLHLSHLIEDKMKNNLVSRRPITTTIQRRRLNV